MRSNLVAPLAAFIVMLSSGSWAQQAANERAADPAVQATTPLAAPADAAPAAAASPAPAPVAEGCRPLTDKAMAADLKALGAQAQKAEPAVLLPLHTAAAALWAQAVEACDGRAKERAQRNLNDAQKASNTLGEQLGNSPECGAAHKDAAMLQDMARSALGERRWADAASLFRKAEDRWDIAVDRCTGSQKATAEKRLAQAEVDGYNAEFCAPLFDKAREYTQKLRASAPGMSREDKNDGLMVAETLWREAKEQCKGNAAQESARNNAQALARERGTPWVPRSAPAADPATQTASKPAVAGAAAAASGAAALANNTTPAAKPATAKEKTVAALEWSASPGDTAVSNAAAAAPQAATAVASTAAAPAAASASSGSALSNLMASILPAASATAVANAAQAAKAVPVAEVQPESFAVGDMRFKGQFVRDANAPTFSGTGQLSWANGDVFEGSLQQGKRHGKGLFVWANGQRYRGDWVHDTPTGQAVVDFANGNHYEGAVVEGIPDGSGHMVFASGDTYTGQFKRGEPEGQGSYVWKNGQKLEGNWVGGKPNGAGALLFANGDRYQGQFKDGEPHQKGVFSWVNGDRYDGEWKAGLKDGKGVFTWANGDRWEGTFQADAQTDQGSLIRKSP